MNNKNKVAKAIITTIALAGISASASAELYVSPVIERSATTNTSSTEYINNSKVISGKTKEHGKYLLKDKVIDDNLLRFGRNVPLFVALDKVVPDSSEWTINFESGLNNTAVNWDGGDSWEDVIKAIEDNSGLHIVVNHDEKAIGVSKKIKLARGYAHKNPLVWEIKSGHTLRDNVKSMAEKAGYKVVWKGDLEIDYIIQSGALLVGEFDVKDGVLDKVLYSFRDADVPLTAKFYMGNKTVVIKASGYNQEVNF